MPARLRTTARKRPRQARSRTTVDAILAATAEIVVRDGVAGATTNGIAKRAGVSIGSLYQYFPSKEALVAALIDRHIAQMFDVLSPAIERLTSAPLAEAVREIVGLLIEAHAIDPELHRILVEETPRTGRLGRLAEVEHRLASLARTAFEARRSEIRRTDLDLAADLVIQTVESLTHATVLHRPERLRHPGLVDEIATLIVAYLTTPPPSPTLPPRGGGREF